MRRLAAITLMIGCALALARADGLRDALITDDPQRIAAAVEEIERAPANTPELADTLFAAARACEDTLADPARALRLYDRILAEQPDARVAAAAARRAQILRAQVGTREEHAREAADFARLVAAAERLDPGEVVRRGDALVAAEWPGAPEAALWLADWLRRHERLDEAAARFDAVLARWPDSAHARIALRGGAGAAIEAHDWERAEALASRLPHADDADDVVRQDLLDGAARGRRRARYVVLAWIAVIAAFAGLAGSLAEATLRGGRTRLRWRPPVEVMFLAPIAAVLLGVAFTAHRLIAPAVATVILGALGMAYLSGATLDTLRARGRSIEMRALLHIVGCTFATLALVYLALMRDDLLDIVLETVRFGPE
jgi:tetratricopeptide (TPR) repeat protein